MYEAVLTPDERTVENYTPFDVAPDGRFIMARRVRANAARIPPLSVTENWLPS